MFYNPPIIQGGSFYSSLFCSYPRQLHACCVWLAFNLCLFIASSFWWLIVWLKNGPVLQSLWQALVRQHTNGLAVCLVMDCLGPWCCLMFIAIYYQTHRHTRHTEPVQFIYLLIYLLVCICFLTTRYCIVLIFPDTGHCIGLHSPFGDGSTGGPVMLVMAVTSRDVCDSFLPRDSSNFREISVIPWIV